MAATAQMPISDAAACAGHCICSAASHCWARPSSIWSTYLPSCWYHQWYGSANRQAEPRLVSWIVSPPHSFIQLERQPPLIHSGRMRVGHSPLWGDRAAKASGWRAFLLFPLLLWERIFYSRRASQTASLPAWPAAAAAAAQSEGAAAATGTPLLPTTPLFRSLVPHCCRPRM